MLQMYLKLLQKEQLKKTAGGTGDLIWNKIAAGIKLLIKLQQSQKLPHRIIQKQMKKEYFEKNIYLKN